MSITDVDQVHDRLMREDNEYREGYEFVKTHNRLFYERNYDADCLCKMAEILTGFWDANDLKPHGFSLGAAVALLEVAAGKEQVA